MRTNLWILTCVEVFCATILHLDHSAKADLPPFADGFENIAVADYPDENGWHVLFGGKAASVTNACAHSGTKSFCLDSYPNWAHMDYVYLDKIPDLLTYEVSIRVDPMYGRSALAGFMKGVANEGPVWNYFWVSGDTGEVQFVGLDGTHVGEYTPGTWCTVRADLDLVNLTGDLWLNGNLIVEDVPIRPKEFDTDRYGHVVLNQWGVMSCNYSGGSTNVVYFDDVRLEAVPAPGALVLGAVGLSCAGWRLRRRTS